MKKTHLTILAVAVGLVLAGFAAVVVLQSRRPAVDNAFEVLNTVEYRGHEGRFTSHSAGVLGIGRLDAGPEGIPYSYGLSAEAAFHEDYDGAEWNIADLYLIRDPETERLTGGTEFFKNMAVVANNVLSQVTEPVPLDGHSRERTFRLNARSSDFPDELTYRLSGSRQRLTRYGNCAAVLAESEPFSYTDPETGQAVRAVHRKLAVLDESMNELYFLCSAFTASQGRGELHIETLMTRMEGEEAVSLEGLDEEFNEYFESLELKTRESELASTDAMPMWAMHSLAVRGAADITAGGAIEGKSNFAITATVGLVLLADAGVSLTTGLMQEAGVIDWKWDGIPNYVGQGVGLGAAAGYSTVSGEEVDSDKWRKTGGLGGDVASLFIPTHAKAHGVRVGTKGVKTVKTGLAGKNLRISRQGMDIVRGGSGWQGSADIGRRLFEVQDTLSAARTALHAMDLGEELKIPDQEKPHREDVASEEDHEVGTLDDIDRRSFFEVPENVYRKEGETYVFETNLKPHPADRTYRGRYTSDTLNPSGPRGDMVAVFKGKITTYSADHVRKVSDDDALVQFARLDAPEDVAQEQAYAVFSSRRASGDNLIGIGFWKYEPLRGAYTVEGELIVLANRKFVEERGGDIAVKWLPYASMSGYRHQQKLRFQPTDLDGIYAAQVSGTLAPKLTRRRVTGVRGRDDQIAEMDVVIGTPDDIDKLLHQDWTVLTFPK